MPLQKQFRGLNDHVGSYQGGNLVFELSDVVSPVLSAEDFVNPIVYTTWQATLTAVGQSTVSPFVPEGEFWRVRHLGLNSLAATAATTFHPVWSNGIVFFGLSDNYTNPGTNAWASGQTALQGIQFENDGFILRPGMQMGWVIRSYAGAGNVSTEGIIAYQLIKF